MKNTWNLKEIAKSFKKGRKKWPDHLLMHPQREWYFGLLLFIVLLISGTAYQVYNFFYYSSVENTVVVDQLTVVSYKESRAESILKEYNARSETFASILDQYRVLQSQTSVQTEEVSTTTSTTTGEFATSTESAVASSTSTDNTN